MVDATRLHRDRHRGRRLHRHRHGLGGGGQLHRRGRCNPGGAGSDTVAIDTANPTRHGRHRRRRAERRRHQLGGDLHLQRGAGRLHASRHHGRRRHASSGLVADRPIRWSTPRPSPRTTASPAPARSRSAARQLHRRGAATPAARAPTPSRSTPLNPTVTVDIVDGALSDGDTSSVVTFTFSEAPVGFDASRHHGGGRHGRPAWPRQPIRWSTPRRSPRTTASPAPARCR